MHWLSYILYCSSFDQGFKDPDSFKEDNSAIRNIFHISSRHQLFYSDSHISWITEKS